MVRVGGAPAPARAATAGAATAGAAATRADAKTADGEPKRKLPPNLGLLGGAAAVMALLVVAVAALLMGQLKKPGAGDAASGPVASGGGTPAATSPAGGTTPAAGTTGAPPAGGATAVTPEGTPPATGAPETAAPPAASPARATTAPKSSPPAQKPAATAPAKGGSGTVRLMTRPFQPSTFFVDGDPYAFDVGFLSKSMPAGDHVLRVEGIGGGAVDVPVHVEPGGNYSLVAEFPNAGTLGSIEIALSGATRAQVLVDGAQYPEPAPCTVRGLAPGPHRITVVRPKSAPAQGPAEVTVGAGATARAEYRFGAGR